MKYMFRLTTFATLCLLVASCHSSSSSSKISSAPSVSSSAIVQGVIEMGKVDIAECNVVKASSPTMVYSKATVQNGSYAVIVPREPFTITCDVTDYVSVLGTDNGDATLATGQSIKLSTVGFVETAEEKTMNINILTTLVAHEIGNGFTLIKHTSEFDDAQKTAITKLNNLYGISIGNLDELRLKDKGVLAKVTVAVQKKIGGGTSFDGNPAVISKADIAAITTLTGFNSFAIVDDFVKLTPPALTAPVAIVVVPTSKPKPGIQDLDTARIGGFQVDSNDLIDITQPVTFSIGFSNVVLENEKTDSVYLTSKKAGAKLIPLVADTAKSVYTAADVKDLFMGNTSSTGFIVCILPTITTQAATDVDACKASQYQHGFITKSR